MSTMQKLSGERRLGNDSRSIQGNCEASKLFRTGSDLCLITPFINSFQRMTAHQKILDLFMTNGNKLTLGYLLGFPFGYKAVSRFSELRDKGYNIICQQDKKNPSNNLYTLIPPEPSGQMRLM